MKSERNRQRIRLAGTSGSSVIDLEFYPVRSKSGYGILHRSTVGEDIDGTRHDDNGAGGELQIRCILVFGMRSFDVR